jgi:hypothetical protein
VCGIELDEDEIRHVMSNFGTYLGDDAAGEKTVWEQAIVPPDIVELY